VKLAVTGGAGFLGFHLCNKLANKFEKILVVDIAPINPSEYPENAVYSQVDVRNFAALDNVLSKADVIVHAAAALPLWKEKDIFDTNIKGTINVLESALENNIERVVFVSSTAVYGVPEKHPIYEDDPLIGVGPYGESKIEAEKVCEQYRQKGLCVPVVRPKTFIGSGRLGVFQILYDWVENGKKIPVIGNGKNRYQLLEVEDLVEAIYLTLTLPEEKVNNTFNIGAKNYGTVLEDVGALCDFAGTGAKVMPIPSFIVKPILEVLWLMRVSPLYKWVYGTADKDSFVAIEKAERVLNWEPKHSNVEALVKSYKWYLNHKDELSGSGITHRVAWRQGILKFFKRFL